MMNSNSQESDLPSLQDRAADVEHLIELIRTDRSARDMHPVLVSVLVHLTAYRERLLDADELATELERHLRAPHIPMLAPLPFTLEASPTKRMLEAVVDHLRGQPAKVE